MPRPAARRWFRRLRPRCCRPRERNLSANAANRPAPGEFGPRIVTAANPGRLGASDGSREMHTAAPSGVVASRQLIPHFRVTQLSRVIQHVFLHVSTPRKPHRFTAERFDPRLLQVHNSAGLGQRWRNSRGPCAVARTLVPVVAGIARTACSEAPNLRRIEGELRALAVLRRGGSRVQTTSNVVRVRVTRSAGDRLLPSSPADCLAMGEFPWLRSVLYPVHAGLPHSIIAGADRRRPGRLPDLQ